MMTGHQTRVLLAMWVASVILLSGCTQATSQQSLPDTSEAMLACGIAEPSPGTAGGKYAYDDGGEAATDAATISVEDARKRSTSAEEEAGHASAAALLASRWNRLAEATASVAALESAVLSARKRGENPYVSVDKAVWDAYFAATPVVDAECTGLVTVLNNSKADA